MSGARNRWTLLLPAALLTLGIAGCESPAGIERADRAAPAPTGASFSTMPAQGADTTLDFGTWNVEWFGDESNGPSDEQLQLENVAHVITDLDMDLWSLQEVVDHAHFDSLVARLDGYEGLLADDPFVTNGPEYYSDFEDTELKVALLYKSTLATLDSARVILTDYDHEFAGRPPVKVDMTLTLNDATAPLVMVLLHAKAGSRGDAWERRQAGSVALKDYLDTNYPTTTVWVIGDFNDDVDESIQKPKESPYKNFVDDSVEYTFPTEELSLAGETSTVYYSEMIDHHLNTNESFSSYIDGTVQVFYADEYVDDYDQTTSDHYPVLTSHTWGDGSGGGDGGTTNSPPSASFDYACTELACDFTDTSTDSDGTVSSWEWDVDGDGRVDYTVQNPSHTYDASGTYTVTLTVTDDEGATDSHSADVTVDDGTGSGALIWINEAEQNPAGGDRGNEWAELYNPNDVDVDVTGWIITANSGSSVSIELSGSVPAGGYMVVEHNKQWLDNSDEWVTLVDEAGTLVDETPLLDDAQNDDRSWQRAADGSSTWEFRTHTRGASNGG